MVRVALRLYINPGTTEIFLNLKRRDGTHQRTVAVIDTGAAITLLPAYLMPDVEYRLTEKSEVIIEQAGIARQVFKATETFVKLFLEDESGVQSQELEARVWFAETQAVLLGFEGVLDRAVLHIDMLNLEGWIEL